MQFESYEDGKIVGGVSTSTIFPGYYRQFQNLTVPIGLQLLSGPSIGSGECEENDEEEFEAVSQRDYDRLLSNTRSSKRTTRKKKNKNTV
jgi:hypothetical protein